METKTENENTEGEQSRDDKPSEFEAVREEQKWSERDLFAKVLKTPAAVANVFRGITRAFLLLGVLSAVFFALFLKNRWGWVVGISSFGTFMVSPLICLAWYWFFGLLVKLPMLVVDATGAVGDLAPSAEDREILNKIAARSDGGKLPSKWNVFAWMRRLWTSGKTLKTTFSILSGAKTLGFMGAVGGKTAFFLNPLVIIITFFAFVEMSLRIAAAFSTGFMIIIGQVQFSP